MTQCSWCNGSDCDNFESFLILFHIVTCGFCGLCAKGATLPAIPKWTIKPESAPCSEGDRWRGNSQQHLKASPDELSLRWSHAPYWTATARWQEEQDLPLGRRPEMLSESNSSFSQCVGVWMRVCFPFFQSLEELPLPTRSSNSPHQCRKDGLKVIWTSVTFR